MAASRRRQSSTHEKEGGLEIYTLRRDYAAQGLCNSRSSHEGVMLNAFGSGDLARFLVLAPVSHQLDRYRYCEPSNMAQREPELAAL